MKKDISKEKEWIQKLESFEKSNLSAAKWCHQNNEALHCFNYWKKRLKKKEIEFDEISLPAGVDIQCKKIQLTFTGEVDLNVIKACLCSL